MMSAKLLRPLLLGVSATLLWATSALAAFEVPADEKDRLKSCEQSLCEMLLKKEASGPDLACKLSKTWAADSIKGGVEQKQISWGMGDARCSVDLAIKRELIHKAMTEKEYELAIPEHKVSCEAESGADIAKVSLSIAPKLMMKDGKATTATLGISNVEGPAVVSGAIWSVAKIEEYFGLFQGEMISEVNKFIAEKCPERYKQ
jgi:hypothetical protein